MRRTAGPMAAALTAALLAIGLTQGSADAAGSLAAVSERTVTFESASALVHATSTGTAEPFVVDYEFTGSITSGSGCYSLWLNRGIFPGHGTTAMIGTACAGQPGSVQASRPGVRVDIGGPVRTTFWLVVCRGTTKDVCGQYVTIE